MISEDVLEDLKKKIDETFDIKEFSVESPFEMYSISAKTKNQKYLLKVYPSFSNEIIATQDRRTDIAYEIKTIPLLYNLLPDLFPKIVHYSEKKHYIVLSHSSNINASLWGMFNNNQVTDDICGKLGRSLGIVHSKLRTSDIAIRDIGNKDIRQNILLSRYNPNRLPIFEGFVGRMLRSYSQLILGNPSPKNIAIDEGGFVIFLDISSAHNGNVIVDIGYICAHLLLHSNLSVQKAQAFLWKFFKGYNEFSSFDYETDDFKIAVLGAMLYRLESIEHDLPPVIKTNKNKIIKNILSTLREIPRNFQSLINSVFGTGGINYGKLDGCIISSKQIIYHKREGSEFSINLTNECPNSCVFCIRDFSPGWDRQNPSGEIVNLYLNNEPTLEEVINSVLEELSNWKEGVSLIKFCGYGEPVLRMEMIIEVTKIIKKYSPNSLVQINTSGWPLLKYYGKKYLKILKDVGVDIISISVDAPTKGIYDKIVRPGSYKYVADAYEKTFECIRLAVENGFKVKATVVDIPIIHSHLNEFRELVEKLGAEFIVREFIGKELAGFDKDGKDLIEMETKVLGINRRAIIEKLESLGAIHRLSGITRILHYDLPDDNEKRQKILKLIEKNIPEFRRYFSMLSIIAQCIREGTNLYQRGGFLRIRNEGDKVAIIYKEPEKINKSIKKEKEYYYDVESEEFAISLVKEWHLVQTRFIEKNRESYLLDGVIYDIDTWPRLDTYLEVEAPDEMSIFQGLSKIGISPNEALGIHTEKLFIEHGINPQNLIFTEDELRKIGL